MNNAKLQIYPEPSPEALTQRFNLIGTVDVDCIPVLEMLYVLPENASAELDFAMVQRVNSMGLAQMLKLFEHWQQREIQIKVINTNRMIGVLFKMTGLSRFLEEGHSTAPGLEQTSPALKSADSLDSPAKSPVNPTVPLSAHLLHKAEDQTRKLNLWVNPQNSDQMNGWYFFNTYLQRQLGREIHLEMEHGAMSKSSNAIESMDLVFTNPFESCRLFLEHDFSSLLRPTEQTDEVTLLVRADDTRQRIADFNGGKVVTAASDNFVYLLGRFMLEEAGSSFYDLNYLFSGHDIKSLQMLLKGNADILLMLSETYQGLSGLTKKMLREIDQSESAFAFHLFSVAPHRPELGKAVTEVLLKMSQDRQGQQVLADLNILAWAIPKPDEIHMMERLFKRYANTSFAENTLKMGAH